MRIGRFVVGVGVSIAWLAGAAFMLYLKRAEWSAMSLNAWGDFCAGAFAPLAFLWLVLGYLQQGEELNLSTKALQLQAEELKNSVEQQRALVDVSRQQVESEREALAYERQLRDESAKPNFMVASGGGVFRGDGQSRYEIDISNSGSMASEVFVHITYPDGRTTCLNRLPLCDRGFQVRTGFDLSSPFDGIGRLVFTYKDGLGRSQSTAFSVGRENENPHSQLSFTRLNS